MATNPAYVQIGQGDVWIGGTPPAAGVDLTDPTTSALNTMVTGYTAPTSGGTAVGLTNGPATLLYKPTYYMVISEQAFAEIIVIPTSEETTLDFMMMEVSYQNLHTVMGQSATKTGGGYNANYVGGLLTVTPRLAVLNSRKRSGVGYYITSIYQAYSQDGISAAFDRRKEVTLKTLLRALADTTRPVGDQLFQIVEYTANP